jgi:dTDP-4-dehydrorhamnose reductase
VLVTGARGQLALSLAEIAGQHGMDLLAVGRPALDVTRQASILDCITRAKPDIVVNAAAFTDVDAAERDHVVAHDVNAEGAGNVAKACARAGIPIVHISTDYVFDGGKPTAYVERDVSAPVNTYGRTKLDGEMSVAAACSRHLILRTAWLYSPFGNNFVRRILRLAGEATAISVVDDQYGSPTYAPHLAHVVLATASHILKTRDTSLWGTYHAAGTGSTSRRGFAELLLVHSAACGGPVAPVHPVGTTDYLTRAKRPLNSRLDCSKLERMFGLALPRWESGVRNCVERILGRIREDIPESMAGRYAP